MTQSYLQGTGSSYSSSHSSNLPFFNRHLASHLNGHVYVKLNSIDEISTTNLSPLFFYKEDYDPSCTPEMATFAVVTHNTNVTIQKSFSSLSNIAKQDVIKWSINFKNLTKLCTWDSHTTKAPSIPYLEYSIKIK